MFACVEVSVVVGTIVPATFACLDRALLVTLQALHSCTPGNSRPSIRNVSVLLLRLDKNHLRIGGFDRLQTITPGDERLDLLEHVWALGETTDHEYILVKSQQEIIQKSESTQKIE